MLKNINKEKFCIGHKCKHDKRKNI
jgi:hypothetical protein